MAYILMIIMMISFVGCWDQKIYENEGFVLSVGYEPSGKDKILMSFLSPVLDPNAKEAAELIYSEEKLLREFRESARKTSDKLIEGGKIQQILISDLLAEKGVNNLLEIIEREPTNPAIAYVVVVEGSPKSMLETAKKFGDKPPRPSIYINHLLENNIKSSYVPGTRVFHFSKIYFAPGIDPITPMIKLQSNKGGGIEVTGSALFAGDKMVGKIDTKETSLLLAIMGEMKKSSFVSDMLVSKDSENGKNGAVFTISKVKRKLSVEITDNRPVMDISLAFAGSLGEFEWNDKYDEDFEKSMEDIVAKEIKQNCEKVLKYAQEVGSDPLGIGDIVRAKHNSYWEKVDWNKDYKNVIFNIKVKFNITNHGGIR